MVFFPHRGPPVAAGFLSLRDTTVKEPGGSVCVQNKSMDGDPQPERKIKIGHGGGDDEMGEPMFGWPLLSQSRPFRVSASSSGDWVILVGRRFVFK